MGPRWYPARAPDGILNGAGLEPRQDGAGLWGPGRRGLGAQPYLIEAAQPYLIEAWPTLHVIPSIEQLRQRDAVRRLEARFGRAAVVAALRAEAQSVRSRLADAPDPDADREAVARRIESSLARQLPAALSPSLRPVINATGVIVHTNLGRAPLGRPAVDRLAAVAGYANLEYDLDRGGRGSRGVHARALLRRLTGAEDAAVVNNNAAAVLLAVAALAAGREVLISRGELVEIGGGFRIPDVLRQSGALLREVGTTNRTRAADYAAAISDRSALILRVHPSNFRIEGFTERPPLAALTALGRQFDLPVVEDLGSGNLLDGSAWGDGPGGGDEPTVGASVEAGVAVCCFSGDKLLGGPQAGILVGRRDHLQPIRRHPLMRALRADKLAYAALEATLLEHATGRAARSVPVLAMIRATVDGLDDRARSIAASLTHAAGLTLAVGAGESTIGGGTTPGLTLPTRLLRVRLDGCSADSPRGAAARRRAARHRPHRARRGRARPAHRPARGGRCAGCRAGAGRVRRGRRLTCVWDRRRSGAIRRPAPRRPGRRRSRAGRDS